MMNGIGIYVKIWLKLSHKQEKGFQNLEFLLKISLFYYLRSMSYSLQRKKHLLLNMERIWEKSNLEVSSIKSKRIKNTFSICCLESSSQSISSSRSVERLDLFTTEFFMLLGAIVKFDPFLARHYDFRQSWKKKSRESRKSVMFFFQR